MDTQFKPEDRILNCLPSKEIEKNWTLEHAVASGILQASASFPASIDLREPWWDIGDQRDSGSCVGWGTADSVIRWHFVKAGRLPKEKHLSVRYIWMAAKESDAFTSYPTTFLEMEGTFPTAALDIARKFGCATDDLLPFRLPDSSGQLELEKLYREGDPATELQMFYGQAAKLKIAGFYNLGTTNLDNWKAWLAARGPIVASLSVDNAFFNATKANPMLDNYTKGLGGHCVAIVGYGYKGDRFIIRNSWGKYWGDGGFAYASKAYIQAAFSEAYGVVV